MQISILNLFAIGLGGFIGALCRFFIAYYFESATFPYATLIVNICGSFGIGILFALLLHYDVEAYIRGFLIAGFLGALTTYSTFALETFLLLKTHFGYGILNMCLNLFGSLGAVGVGVKIMSDFLR